MPVIYFVIVAVAAVSAAVIGFKQGEDLDVIGSYALGTVMVVGAVLAFVHVVINAWPA